MLTFILIDRHNVNKIKYNIPLYLLPSTAVSDMKSYLKNRVILNDNVSLQAICVYRTEINLHKSDSFTYLFNEGNSTQLCPYLCLHLETEILNNTCLCLLFVCVSGSFGIKTMSRFLTPILRRKKWKEKLDDDSGSSLEDQRADR